MPWLTSIWGMNNDAMAVGYVNTAGGRSACFVDAALGLHYIFNEEDSLTNQLNQLILDGELGADSYFERGFAINDFFIEGSPNPFGAIVGYIVDPSNGVNRGYVISTGGSLNIENWILELLPHLNSPNVQGRDVNNAGDVLVYFGDQYLYNPWLPDPPAPLGLASGGSSSINNVRHIAVKQSDTIVLFDGTKTPPELIDEINLLEGKWGGLRGHISLNDRGVIGGALYDQQIGGGGKGHDIAFQYDSDTQQSENVLLSSSYTMFLPRGPHFMNLQGDMVIQIQERVSGKTYTIKERLVHKGVSPDFTKQDWRVNELIDEDDPLRDLWIADGTVIGITNRGEAEDDASSFPVIVGIVTPPSQSSTVTLLVPSDIAAP